MSKKKLLSEAQVRRFMGLAGLKPLNEMSHYKMDDEKDTMMEEEADMAGDDMAGDDMAGDDMGDAEAQIDEEELMAAIDGVEQGLSALKSIASSAGLEAGGMGDMDMSPVEAEEELEAEEEEIEDEEELEDEEIDQELQEVNMEMTEEEIVNEVARRVASRIVEAKRAHQKMNEALGRKTVKGARPKLRRR